MPGYACTDVPIQQILTFNHVAHQVGMGQLVQYHRLEVDLVETRTGDREIPVGLRIKNNVCLIQQPFRHAPGSLHPDIIGIGITQVVAIIFRLISE